MNKWNKIFEEGVNYIPLNNILLNKILNRIKKIAPNNQLNSMIDIGCGTGKALLKFSERGFNVSAIDISEVAIEKATELLEKAKIDNFNLSILDSCEVSSITENFDIVFSKFVYAFIGDKEKFLENLKGLMHKDSIFILMTAVLHDDINYLAEDKPQSAINFEETKRLLEKTYSSVEIFQHNYFSERGDVVTFIIKK